MSSSPDSRKNSTAPDKGLDQKTPAPAQQATNAASAIPNVPKGPWGDRGVTSPTAGLEKPNKDEKDSSLNVRINLDLRADVALELHAVIQGNVTIGLF
ncbi:hypothetical protein F9C07_2286909 [Aspergillus flavus]|uniref:Uncharacterized protein n=4 Tax=Aspergillus subgen. Circumdati TaxID=2720871 RepID=B8NVD0_ASPFN|nr:uncharacterized protein G4B84_012253 [Aspergillus flavus NRRL3357]KAB8241191.1 hypothetical protein BDV35DRAFT_397911 [Aspergillus flavus]KOC18797.1 hypothetical protein AFLA70_4g008930 [Aspergillus flavus AF70]OOO07351.1 hypothetical protein OAory_01038510 [Aspergillus oryzae]GMG47065.1 unnamed protein product [Aspergillus oryzae var. brunneus]KAF7626184.1 hypothetical protein AFLA_013579 [Aspergillus flavus NRRL3357]